MFATLAVPLATDLSTSRSVSVGGIPAGWDGSAGSHCESTARTQFHATVFGWLEGVLGGEIAREGGTGLLKPMHGV
jgi:hypothetical protein